MNVGEQYEQGLGAREAALNGRGRHPRSGAIRVQAQAHRKVSNVVYWLLSTIPVPSKFAAASEGQ